MKKNENYISDKDLSNYSPTLRNAVLAWKNHRIDGMKYQKNIRSGKNI